MSSLLSLYSLSFPLLSAAPCFLTWYQSWGGSNDQGVVWRGKGFINERGDGVVIKCYKCCNNTNATHSSIGLHGRQARWNKLHPLEVQDHCNIGFVWAPRCNSRDRCPTAAHHPWPSQPREHTFSKCRFAVSMEMQKCRCFVCSSHKHYGQCFDPNLAYHQGPWSLEHTKRSIWNAKLNMDSKLG